MKMPAHPIEHLYTVILAGGEGVRFAPLSTLEMPKQFLPILHPEKSLLQQTHDRARTYTLPDHIWISTHSRYLTLVSGQLPEISPRQIIGETHKKNTAPPIAWLSRLIYQKDPDAIVLFLPSDHYIHDEKKAVEIFREAACFAGREDCLLTFGIVPSFPSTQYGYIKLHGREKQSGAMKALAFVEKPGSSLAQEYFDSGVYLWNSGIFLWRASIFLNELEKHMPALFSALDQAGDNPELFFDRAQAISIDYGLMERSKNVVVFPFQVGWSDVGTWDGLRNLKKYYQLNLPAEVENYLRIKT